MDFNNSNITFLKHFGKLSILKELVDTLHPRYKSISSYNKLFTSLLKSESFIQENYQNKIIDMLLGFNIPGIEERLFPIYWGLSETLSSIVERDKFAILPGENFQFFNFFDEFKIKNEGRSEPLLIATLPNYALYVPLLLPSLSLPVFKFLNCYKDNHHLAEIFFGPAAIFSVYFTFQNSKSIENFHFLFKNELLKFTELKNTSKVYIELSGESSYKGEILSQKSNLEQLPDISNKWNLDNAIKLFKDYISLNIPPSEIYLEEKNEPAKMPDIINASWFYFFENILPNTLLDFQQQDISHPLIQDEYNSANTIEEPGKRRSFTAGKSASQDDWLSMLLSKSIIWNPHFSEQLSNLCALILRGLETSNIFRKLL